jgi:beta-lactamase regulating signal transducer with metallopeptidase domain
MSFSQFAETGFRLILVMTSYGSILAILAWLLQAVFRGKLGPGWRHALWFIVLLRLLLPIFPETPFSIFNLPRWFQGSQTAPETTATSSENSSLTSEQLLASAPEPVIRTSEGLKQGGELMRLAAVGWLVIASALSLRLLIGSCWLRIRLAGAVTVTDPSLVHALCEARSRIRTIWRPRMIETPIVDSPGLFGCFIPKLLLPPGFERQLSPAELRHVLLHELAHLSRGDLWINLLSSIVHALHWFNPLVWVLVRKLRIERELACDVIVLKSGGPREAHLYGETILKLVEGVQGSRGFGALVGVIEEKRSIALRIAQIASYPNKTGVSRMVGIAITTLLAVIGLSNAQDQKTAPAAGSGIVSRSVAEESSPGVATNLNNSGRDVLPRDYLLQKEQVEKLQKQVDELRGRFNITDVDQRASDSEYIGNLERDRVAAQARYIHDKKLVDELKKRTRPELRKLIPTAAPDPAMDRYLGDLAKIEQQYASNVNDFGPVHPEIVKLIEMKKVINQQIEDRIDGVVAGAELQVAQTKALLGELEKRIDMAREQDAKTRQEYAPYFAAKRHLENQQRVLDLLYMKLLAEKQNTEKPWESAESSVLVQDARLLMELGKLDEAETKLNEAFKQKPEHPAARYYLKQIKDRRNGVAPAARDVIGSTAAPNNLVLTIGRNTSEIHLNGGEVTIARLKDELTQAVSKDPNVVVTIQPERDAPVQTLIDVLDAAKAARVSKLSIQSY